MPQIGVIFPPDQPPERLLDVARATDASGLDELWLWEDCFAEGGISAAGIALAATERIRVGIGLLPVPLRNVALTAMEVATLARVFPGRLLPGIGHGVQSWMRQVGAKPASPLTLLREHAEALRRLFGGERVRVDGRYVRLDGVQLAWPPSALPLLVGAEGQKTLALAGEVGEGIIFTGGTGADGVRAGLETARRARAAAGVEGELDVVVFHAAPVDVAPASIAAEVRALEAAGATRIAFCALSPDGRPEAGARILDFIAAVDATRDLR